MTLAFGQGTAYRVDLDPGTQRVYDLIDAALVSYLEGDGSTWTVPSGRKRMCRRLK